MGRLASFSVVLLAALSGCSKPAAVSKPASPPKPLSSRVTPVAAVQVVSDIPMPTPRAPVEKFILFTLEKPDSADETATAWEYDPSIPEQGLRRVHDFGPSSCEAWLVFWGNPTVAPQYVRVPVLDEDRKFQMIHLCQIDYRTWTVQILLRSPSINVMGLTDQCLQIHSDDKLFLIDRKSGEIREPDSPCTVRYNLGETYVVEVASGKPSGALFDRDRNRLLSVRFEIPTEWNHRTHLVLSPDRARIAELDFEEGGDPQQGLDYGESRVVAARLRVHDLAAGTAKEMKNHTIVHGTNRPFIGWEDEFAWSTDGSKLTCRTWRAGDEGGPPSIEGPEGYEQLTIDAKSLSVLSREPVPTAKVVPETEETVPAFLRKEYDATRTATEGGRRLAHAFLRHKGVEYEIPGAVLETEVGFTPDRRRFLLKMVTGSASAEFFYGDLETQELRRLPAPSALVGVFMGIYGVTLP